MTEKRPTPDESAGKGRRKSAAPTIDLKATEVKASAGEPPRDKPSVKEPPAAEPPVEDPTKKDPPIKEPPKPKPQPAESQSSRSNAAPPPVDGKRPGGAIAAGVAGALVMSLVLAGAWYAGLLTPGDTGSNAQVTALEKQIQELRNRPAPPSINTDALQTRIAKMEDALKNLPTSDSSGLSERVSAADSAMKSLGLALTALNRRNEEVAEKALAAQQRADAAEKAVSGLRASVQDVSKTANAGASSAELEPLQKRIEALEQQIKTTQAQIEKASAADRATQLALSAAALRDAVTRGAPFAGELTQAKSLGADEKMLEPLVPFAATGLPSEKQLAVELRALLPALQKAAGSPKPSGNFIERLQANAENLVRIRPVDAPPGDDPSAVLARLEADAARDDINVALADIGKLPEAARQQAAAWVTRAAARQKAIDSVKQFAAATARALGPK